MKNIKYLFAIMAILIAVVFSSCSSTSVVIVPKKAPPGQVKKVTGSKSAKPYAPGQQKKKKH